MNFFNKGNKKAPSPEPEAPVSPPPTAPVPLSPPPLLHGGDEDAFDARDAAPMPSTPPEEVTPRKPRLRFKKPHFKLPRRPASPSPPPPTAAGAAFVPPPAEPDASRLSRRASRRRERDRKEHEWNEENRRRRNEAALTGLPVDPLPPLPAFDSASEEGEPDAVVSESFMAEGMPAQAERGVQRGMEAKALYYPEATYPEEGAPVLGALPDLGVPMEGGLHSQAVNVPLAPQPPPTHTNPSGRDAGADVQMAEMFGAQAYSGHHPQPQMTSNHVNGAAGGSSHAQGPAMPPAQHPTPIGWGDVYSSFPSKPMYAPPMQVHGGSRAPLGLDPVLAEKIRQGRELASLAIAQEEQGNLGAAENGYMKALGLLVPASKELDVGSELNKNARMLQKAKVQREAAAMLDRCEELRLFLKANGPPVPSEMPKVPSLKPPPGRKGGGGGGGGGGAAVPRPRARALASSGPGTERWAESADLSAGTTDLAPLSRQAPPPPPPAPPSFEAEADGLFARISSRKNILTAASAGTHLHSGTTPPVGSEMSPPAKSKAGAKCFMCSAPAEVQGACSHTFCSSCGNQAASVFEQCPDPTCNAPLSAANFKRLA